MPCSEYHDHWLDRAAGDPDARLARHLAECAECRQQAELIARIETAYRAWPIPASVDDSRREFLKHLPASAASPQKPRDRRAPRLVPTWSLLASVLLVIALLAGLLSQPGEAQAQEELLGRLIDWNLQLLDPARAQDAPTAEVFQSQLQRVRLDRHDRALAESLLTSGRALQQRGDPLTSAERLDAVAHAMMQRAREAVRKGDGKRALRTVKQYRRVVDRGLDALLIRLDSIPGLDEPQQRRLDRLLQHDADREVQIASILDHSTPPTRKELRKAFEPNKKRGKTPKKDRPKEKAPNGAGLRTN